ncbi:hypothetical protein CAEBREN_32358 [Caenorhabditis brenneri]|uniref:C-type lectin domain-containing protein n=1 Tax=Caenorhabditis brenneri TaxID=135651 RepID=G0NZA1_CAEBE|nr:hypothetical protein CAEBREN_32358 [Caenorhabditis brenneri]
MYRKAVVFLAFLITINAAEFGSDSSSCEDDDDNGRGHGHGHGNGHGGGNNGCPRGWRRFSRSSGGWCMRTSFYWTDGATTGTAGFSWLDGSQPDNALGGNQDCIAFFFAPSNTRIATVNWFPGAMDDVNCDASQFNSIPQRKIQGYVCGKDASS